MISRNWFRNNLEWSIFRKVIWVEIFKSWKWRSRKFYVNCFCWVMKIILYYMIRIVIINIKIIIMMSFLFFFWKRFVMEVNMLLKRWIQIRARCCRSFLIAEGFGRDEDAFFSSLKRWNCFWLILMTWSTKSLNFSSSSININASLTMNFKLL